MSVSGRLPHNNCSVNFILELPISNSIVIQCYIRVYECYLISYAIGMEILGELAWCIDNAELLAEMPDELYERIIFCTLVPDVEVC